MPEHRSAIDRANVLRLDKCKGCDAVGLVEIGEVPMCARCLPNSYAIHLAEETVKRAAQKT